MANKHDSLKSLFSDIANSIRGKTGSTDTIIADQFPGAIDAIPTGGGGAVEVDRGVIFVDYDGSIVESWESAYVASKTSLPPNPSHTGLVAQGWNWSLADIKSYISSYPNATVYVGQMYKTASGLTEIDITVTKVTGLTVTCNMVGNKHWGDGTTDNTTEHTYTDYGNYTITCDGTAIPAGTSSSGGMFGNTSSSVSAYWCTAIRIGGNVTKIGNYAFSNCCSLTNVTIPSGVTSIGTSAFTTSRSLKNVTIPSGITSIGSTAFSNCCSLTNFAIPSSVTIISNSAFNACYSFTNVTIPSGITSIGNSAFASCYSLKNVTIPSGVTSIGTSTFSANPSITTYDFAAAASVPTIASNTFAAINGICKIVVPDALYDDWIAATNWATYADYIYKASEVVE